jgi:DNA-binding MarR family transcriptional regulator
MPMNPEARHELSLLEAVEQNGDVTQRGLSAKLGMALGLTNIYVKRLVRKGYIKCVNVQPNRLFYLITPTGIAEKTRLTYEYMEYSLRVYRETRHRFRTEMARHMKAHRSRIAIYGTGEAAELAYLCLRELGIEPVAVFDGDSGGEFLGILVRDVKDHRDVEYDLVVVATMASPEEHVAQLQRHGVSTERIVTLRRA